MVVSNAVYICCVKISFNDFQKKKKNHNLVEIISKYDCCNFFYFELFSIFEHT